MEQPYTHHPARTLLDSVAAAFSAALLATVAITSSRADADRADPPVQWLSPAAIAATSDGGTLYIGCATADLVLALGVEDGRVTNSISLPGHCTGLILSPGGGQLYVSCAWPASKVCQIDVATGRVVRTFRCRHTPVSPVLSPDGKRLYVCERFTSTVLGFDVETGEEVLTVPVAREPIAAALSAETKLLAVAHHLPPARADGDQVACGISLIDLGTGCVHELSLPNGSSLARDIKVSPDGRYACVSHNLARFQLPTTQVERGWMNTSALTVIDLEQRRILNTVLLDEIDRGAANPWAIGWSNDGQWLCVSHAGTHELSLIRFPDLLAKLSRFVTTAKAAPGSGPANDLAFLLGLRERVKLQGNGPRALAVVGDRVFVADYFSDLIEVVDLTGKPAIKRAIPLHSSLPADQVRRGEMLFNDATLCFQGWQSCGTCHSDDGRVDGLSWDLLNDGLGNPKNTKSLLWTHQTPPAMSTGVRETAETAVRAGLQHILFSTQPESVAGAMDAWLKSLQPLSSPYLAEGNLSDAARRGQRLFQSARVGCAGCHPAELWTNLRSYDVGTADPLDAPGQLFDTPALVELWRTAPYLHDGSAATIRDVLTTRNASDRHGHTAHLSREEIDDLLQYLLTL